MRTETVEGLLLSVHGQELGVLVHYSGGKNILTFNPDYAQLQHSERATFTYSQLIDPQFFTRSQLRSTKLPPVLSNLLPEGALRGYMAAELKVHVDDEFSLMLAASNNLPGALVVKPIYEGEIPSWALTSREQVEPIQISTMADGRKFSLAGVQMKFSGGRDRDGRYNIGGNGDKENWIIKTPSTVHKYVPYNEYTAMKLAESIGVEIPELELVDRGNFSGLPEINLPDENMIYTIKRFDRSENGRIHTEDFAQIFNVYPNEKYRQYNYDHIALAINNFPSSKVNAIQQMTWRLLANILLGNGDAHLKNWSVIYRDGQTPELSPAYDIVSTIVYIQEDKGVALNMQKRKLWGDLNEDIFIRWAKANELNERVVKASLSSAIKFARSEWPGLLDSLPMVQNQKELLRTHWKSLHIDFRI